VQFASIAVTVRYHLTVDAIASL